MKSLGSPGFYYDEENDAMHVDTLEILEAMGLEDTPENQTLASNIILKVSKQLLPNTKQNIVNDL